MDVHRGDKSQAEAGGASVKRGPEWLDAWRKANEMLATWPSFALPGAAEAFLKAIFDAMLARLGPLWREDIEQGLARLVRVREWNLPDSETDLREVRPITGSDFTSGTVEIRRRPDDPWQAYVPLGAYVNALRGATVDQSRLRADFADRLVAIAEEGWKTGSLSRTDADYLRRKAEEERKKA